MTIEQKPELNRFVDSSIPLNWSWRWRQLKMTLPIWLFTWACLLEMALLKAWLAGKLNFSFIVMLLAGCLLLPIFAVGGGEIEARIRQRSKRLIQFKDKQLILKPSKSGSISWKRIAKFQFEPIPEMPGTTKLNIFLQGRPKQKPVSRVFWAMVLKKLSDAQELERFLRAKKMETPTNFEVEVLDRPTPVAKSKPFPFFGMSLYFGGAYFLLHGIPGLMVALEKHHHSADGNSKLAPEEAAKLGHFVLRHFSSPASFHDFFLKLNVGLIVVGVALLITGWRLMNRKTQIEPARYS